MSVPSIPTSFTHHLRPDKTFDVDSTIDGGLDTNLSGGFDAKHSGTVGVDMGGKLELDTTNVLTLRGDDKNPVYTDSKMEILNLPRFTLQDIKDMMKVRMRIPNYTNVCFKVMGTELFSICMSGEGQVITEPYIPNAAERCETNCCEPDTRPFPERNDKDDKNDIDLQILTNPKS
jgi:hypothetical protein